MTTDLVIIGSGGHGREMLDIVEAINHVAETFNVLGFLDDSDHNDALLARRGTTRLGPVEMLADIDAQYVIGIGSGAVRACIDRRATELGREAAVLVHPAASMGGDVELAPGVVVAAGARITTNVRLGRHTQLNVNCSVSHDCRLGDYVTVSPGATVSGTVTLEDGVLIGAGATVIQGLTVGRWTTVGAGAVVVRDLPADVVAVGVPARPRREIGRAHV